jgi:hypothetical protein
MAAAIIPTTTVAAKSMRWNRVRRSISGGIGESVLLVDIV